MRKVYVNVTTRLIINADEGVDIGGVIDGMDYDCNSKDDRADIVDTEIVGYEITDSK